MSLSRKFVAATLSASMATGAVLAATAPVSAQSFLDRMFNPRYYENGRRIDRPAPPVEEKVERKPVRISGPRYYTYRAAALKSVSLAALAKGDPKPAMQDAMADTVNGPILTGSTGQGPAVTAAPEETSAARIFDEARGFLADEKLRTYPEVAKAILAHYGRTGEAIWIDDNGVTPRAEAAIEVLRHADRFGLSPEDYRVEMPGRVAALATHVAAIEGDTQTDATIIAPRPEEAARKELIAFEMELSAKVLTYVLDATRGRVDPNKISGYHDLPEKTVDLEAALVAAASAPDVKAYLEGVNPSGKQFKELVAERQRLLDADEGERIEIADDTFLKPGGSSPELASIVAGIRLRGSAALKDTHAITLATYNGSDDYTPELVALVRDFQREQKLTVDGIIGKGTIRALVGDSNADKIRKVELAMERARWLPGDLGNRYVFVNQPAFRVSYVRPDQKPLSMRVVIGRRSNQTSFFTDKLETVEFNPYWGVPLSIIVNEMMPKLRNDPTYLDRTGYEVTTASGARVSSASVDWHSVATRSSTINVRQLPGRSNALGELKILFPNKHAIYMHDTPSKRLFKKDMRAFSHGCIRLQDPRAMAAAVLGKSEDYVASRIAEGRNNDDPVTLNIPIYIAYFTAWPNAETGKVGYFADVYGRDGYLEKAIAATEKARRG